MIIATLHERADATTKNDDVMPDTSDFNKERIVATLNRKYGTTLTVEMVEIAVTAAFSSWESLWLDSATTLAADANEEGPLLPCECGCGKLVPGGLMEAAHPNDYRDERG